MRAAEHDNPRMARITRAQHVLPGALHHVFFRGNNRRRLFSYEGCYLKYLRELERAARKYACAIHWLSLMANHGHLGVTPPSVEALSKMMARVGQQFAVFRNESRAGTGKVFEERFRSKPVLDERYAARLGPYVELNPERAGIVGDLSAYRWSTYWLHVGRPELCRVPVSLWTPSSWWLSLGTDTESRAIRYRELVDACRASGRAWTQDDEYRASVDEVESASRPHTRRLERPDGSRAAETLGGYARQFARPSRERA